MDIAVEHVSRDLLEVGMSFDGICQELSTFPFHFIGPCLYHCDTAVGLQAVTQDDTTTRPQLTVLHVHPCDGVVSYLFDGNVTE